MSPSVQKCLFLLRGLEEVLGGSDSGHVVVCVYETFPDAMSIYLLFVYCMYTVYNGEMSKFSTSKL